MRNISNIWVGLQSFTMMEMTPTFLNAVVLEAFHAWSVRVRVDTMVHEVAKTRFTFFLGICIFIYIYNRRDYGGWK